MAINSDLGATGMVNRLTTAANTSGGSVGLNKLWLPLWSGEVIHAYDQVNMFENMITTKPLSGGYSYEFPITGTVAAATVWEAGVELGGGTASTNTFKVNLDKRPMATYFECDNIDSLITQWDYRSELARQAGLQLANMRDKQIALSILAACSVSQFASSGDPRGTLAFPDPVEVGGLGVTASGCTETAALNILKAIEDYFVIMQENDYPIGNVYCVVTPKVFQVIRGLGLTRSADVLTVASNTNFTPGTNFTKNPMFGGVAEQGGLGAPYTVGMNSMSDSLDYMGCKIVKSNHLPKTTEDNANLALGSLKYNLCTAGFSVYGMIFQPEAIAGLSLQGLKVDSIADVRRNTQFTVASMMKGTGILRPELCQALLAPIASTGVTAAGQVNTRGEVAAILDNGTNGWTTGFAAEYAATV